MKLNMKKSLLLLLSFTIILVGCNTNKCTQSNSDRIDYSLDENWAVKSIDNYPYDIFYIYPTVIYTGINGEMDFTIEEHRSVALSNSQKATAMMSDFANIYAPFYRQSDLNSFAPFKDFSDVASKGTHGISDIANAFLYYINNLNDGRPFIIFAHSQGSAVGFEIIKKYFDNPAISKNFVAAYLSGMQLSKEELAKYPFLHFTQNKDDIGVILVWNLQAHGVGENFFIKRNGLGVNPGNWRIDDKISPAKQIKNISGKIVTQPESILDVSNGATLIDIENADKYEMKEFGKGVYHIGNLSLFMNSISENMENRFRLFGQKSDD